MASILSKGEHFVESNKGVGSAESAGLDDNRETVKRAHAEGPKNKSRKKFLRKEDGLSLKRFANLEGRVPARKKNSLRPDIAHDRENKLNEPIEEYPPVGWRGRNTLSLDFEHDGS